MAHFFRCEHQILNSIFYRHIWYEWQSISQLVSLHDTHLPAFFFFFSLLTISKFLKLEIMPIFLLFKNHGPRDCNRYSVWRVNISTSSYRNFDQIRRLDRCLVSRVVKWWGEQKTTLLNHLTHNPPNLTRTNPTLYCAVLYFTVLYSTLLYYTVLNYAAL